MYAKDLQIFETLVRRKHQGSIDASRETTPSKGARLWCQYD